jgi:cellulose synthase/poly-beta-1,6-N-acetylglucosamine synthase-like glycosyltransferase
MELVSAGKISPDSRVLFVDDGSADKTWDMIRAFCRETAAFAVYRSAATGATRTRFWRG